MAYTAPQIGTILLKADRTMYKIGQIAYENMFAEDNEALDYERDIIFIYKKAVEYADDFFIGTEKLDKVVERLAAKISAYDYGELNPVYADAALLNISTVVAGAALNDLTDVTIANLLDNQFLRYNAATGQWVNVGPGSAVRNSQAFVATAGQTVFTTSFPFDAGLFDLYINGVKINSLSYTTMGEYQITLTDGCAAGDIVDVVIYDPSSAVLPPANSLNDLTDVNLGPLANKQALYYNSTSGLWENGQVFVPYTGAVANTDLGEFEMKAGQFTLDTSPTGVASVGTTRWNDATGTSETTLKGGNVILRTGVDLVARIVNKVTPNTTLTKAAYQAVRVSGAQGQRLAVAFAQANNDANSADTIGLVCETIPTNQEGFIMAVGQLENINTTGSLQGETWVDGDVLYLSPFTPGAITKVKPTGNGHIVVIGYVEYAHANNGKIYVKVMNGWELDELHDVSINTATLANGDVLKYNSTTQLWENGPSTGGITGSGAAGQVAYWDGTTSQAGSADLQWNGTNLLLGNDKGIVLQTAGTNRSTRIVPNVIVDNISSLTFYPSSGTNVGQGLYLAPRGTGLSATIKTQFFLFGTDYVADQTNWEGVLFRAKSDSFMLATGKAGTGTIKPLLLSSGYADNSTNSNHLWLYPTGNVGINSSFDGGQRLQVTGDTLLKGSGNTSGSTALTVQNSAATNIFRVRNDGLSISVGGFAVGGASSFAGIFPSDSGNLPTITINSSADLPTTNITDIVLSNAQGNATITSGTRNLVQISRGFNPTSGTGVYNLLQITTTINQTGGANGITRGLYINPTLTSAADFRAIETSAGNVLFGSNFFWDNANGRLGIGTTTPLDPLHVVGSVIAIRATLANGDGCVLSNDSTTSYFQALTSGNLVRDFNIAGREIIFRSGSSAYSERFRLFLTGNLGIGTGTTDSGQRLQVQGTTLLNGNVTFSSSTGMFWDATNSRLGIGNNAPTNTLTLGSIPVAALRGTSLLTGAFEGGANGMSFTVASSADVLHRVVYSGIRARGTLASPSAVLANDTILTFLSVAYDGSAIQASAGLNFFAEANATSGNAPIGISFLTGSSSLGRTDKVQVRSNGNVLIQNGGTFTDSGERLQVTGTMKVTGDISVGSSFTYNTTLRVLTISSGTDISPQIKFNYTSTLGGDFTSQLSGIDQLSFGFNNSNYFGGGTSGVASGRTLYFFDRIDAVYHGGYSAINGWYFGQSSTRYGLRIENANSGITAMTIKSNGRINMSSLPTSSTGLATGDLWNNGGVINIV